MSEAIVEFLQSKNIPSSLIVFIISMLPVVELRGGLIAAAVLKIPFIKAFLFCYAGNILPIPFILIFIKKIFDFLRDKKGFSKIIAKLESRTLKNSDKVTRWRDWGLFTFVAIPLPGTGGWTGSLIAALIEMPIKKSFPIVSAGVLGAGIIMSVLTYLLPNVFNFFAA